MYIQCILARIAKFGTPQTSLGNYASYVAWTLIWESLSAGKSKLKYCSTAVYTNLTAVHIWLRVFAYIVFG